jgi:hypothetical protein
MVPSRSVASRLAKLLCILGSLPTCLLQTGAPVEAQSSGKSKKDAEKGKPSGEDGEETPKAEAKGKTAVEDADAPFVKEQLKEALHPTKLEFLPDGRVLMDFELGQKVEDHGGIFSMAVGSQLQDVFRWTRSDEERVVGGDPGLRVSDKGMALLKAWFQDDVEVEMQFLQHINFDPRQIAALVFVNAKGAGIGSNYGSQCAQFSAGRMGKATGKPTAVAYNNSARIKLVVKDGVFEAHRDGKPVSKMKYAAKSFPSGQIGIVWGGSISGTITKLTVTGRLDNARMAKDLRKAKK